MIKRITIGFIALGIAIIVIAGIIANPYVRTATAYKAKAVCSEVFVAGRDVDDVLHRDFQRIHSLVSNASISVDREKSQVRSSAYGLLGRTTAVYRPGLGCTIAIDGPPAHSGFETSPANSAPWSIDIDPEIQRLVETARRDDRPVSSDLRAIIVIRDGVLIAEDYAKGFGPDIPMQSWSMAKSVTQAMLAIALDEGIIALELSELMPEWTDGDPRADITVRTLLGMTDGLDFVENYADPASDVSQMLFNSRSMGRRATEASLAHEPGTHWAYSSGTTNILSLILRRAIEESGQAYHRWPYERLFKPIGADSVVFETDADGTFIGSSYLYASPRDWARFGQLYLDGGLWQGERVLPSDAIALATTPHLPETAPYYGGHWWINARTKDGDMRYAGLPETVFYMGGHDGQNVFVIPSKNAVIVRLGMTRPPIDQNVDVIPKIAAIVDAL